jgi:TolA-binding protein
MFSFMKRDTGEKEYKLGREYYNQQKDAEAEQLLRQSAQRREKLLGAEHVNTLESKYWLAAALYCQQKYAEAEQVMRQLVQQREKVLGTEHVNTLESKYWLAVTLQYEQKYAEAEQLLRQSAQQREKLLGAEHVNTLESKYWLAAALYYQQKYTEAEQVIRQLYQQREKLLGVEHVNTLESKYWLAIVLYDQQKLADAGQLFQEMVQQWERVLGAEHVNTLESKSWLEATLYYQQQKYAEAEQVMPQSAVGVPPVATSTLAETVSTRLSNFFTDGSQKQTAYTDSDIQQVSLLLSQVHLQWSKMPRTYMILRLIGCLDLLNTFIDLGVSDHWFPFTERSLPPCLRPGQRLQFVGAQNLVMTKSMDLEKGERGQHCFFRQDEPLPLEMKGLLGSGGYGQVDRVLSTISFREYALKRVSRSTVFRGRTKEDIRRRAECVTQFIAEIEALKRLRHRHVVEFVGSYTDPKYMGLIMSPVADMDLSTYLTRADMTRYRELRTFFGCLTRALAFLHEQKIRHKDIKPSNILVHGGNVLFTDFGLAFDFTDETGSTTASMANGMTLKYCAPEVANHEPRNTSSDIWSLGIVFLEMTAVLKGRTVAYMYNFLKEHGSGQAYVRTNPTGTDILVAELKETGSPADNAPLEWVQDMVMLAQQLRPTAASLMASITGAGQKGDRKEAFCGICCAPSNDFLSSFDELEIADTK